MAFASQAAPLPAAGGPPPPDAAQALMQPVSAANPAVLALMGNVAGVQAQDRAQLAMGQNMILQMIVAQLAENTMSPSEGFAEGATGSAPLADGAPPPGPPLPAGGGAPPLPMGSMMGQMMGPMG